MTTLNSNQMNDSLLERVRKLLAQAEDPAATRAEAEVFNTKAAELIAKYGIEAAVLAHAGTVRDEITQRAVTVHNPYRRDKGQLLASIAEPLRCQTVHYHANYGGTSHQVIVFGYQSDLQRVEILFTSLLVQATTQLVDIRPDGHYGYESTAAYRRSWLAGFTHAIHQRLIHAERNATRNYYQDAGPAGSSAELVLADRTTQVERAFTEAFPRLGTMRTRQLSGSGRSDGYLAGTHADLGTTRLANRRTAIGR